MRREHEIIVSFIVLLMLALMIDEAITATFIFICGALALAITQYGDEKIRRFLRRLLLK